MQTASVAEVKARLSTYLETAKTDGPVVITRNGKAIAMLVATTDEDEIKRSVTTHTQHGQPPINGIDLDESTKAPRSPRESTHAQSTTELLKSHYQISAPPNLSEMSITEREQWVLEQMLRVGLLSEIKTIDRSEASTWEPISIKGKPLSQTIIEDRR